jgi:hypothetical protein
MENDVQLLQKLLKLGETIQELRNSRPVHRASSETSLASSLGEEEENVSYEKCIHKNGANF